MRFQQPLNLVVVLPPPWTMSAPPIYCALLSYPFPMEKKRLFTLICAYKAQQLFPNSN
jgi:hypothetical protein